MKNWLFAMAALATVLGAASPALAFCRATTCDPSDPKQDCDVDQKTRCVTTGAPLAWASDCVTFSIQRDAAPKSGIDYDQVKASVERAFGAWTNADCGGQSPSIRVELSDPIACDTAEYNRTAKNANIIVFREQDWPYEGAVDAFGLTSVHFDLDAAPGEIWDADIEVNAVAASLSVGEPGPQDVDLDSLLTHEAGHALGLAHTLNVQATMIGGYQLGTTGLRTLGDDDVAGICKIYPPTRKASSTSCEPRHGFSDLCAAAQPAVTSDPPPTSTTSDSGSGCSLPHGRRTSGNAWSAYVLAVLACALGARKAAQKRRS